MGIVEECQDILKILEERKDRDKTNMEALGKTLAGSKKVVTSLITPS